VIAYRFFYFRAGRLKRDALLETVLLDSLGVSNLNDAALQLLKPALKAHKAGRFDEETRLFEEAEGRLHTIVLDTRLGNDSDGKTNFSYNLQTKWAISRAITELGLFTVKNPIAELSEPLRQMSFEERFARNSMSQAELDELQFGETWVKCGVQLQNLSPKTKVKVYSEGQKNVNYTSRASLGSAAAGVILPGPAVVYALARPKVVRHEDDDRELSIVVWDKEWEIDVELNPDLKKAAKKFAEALTVHVAKLGGSKVQAKKDSPVPRTTVTKSARSSAQKSDIRQLVDLLNKGLITEEEFKLLKDQNEK
jgi:hypothetical protein